MSAGIPYAATLGLFVGLVGQFIPTVGTYIGAAIPALIALAQSPTKAVLVVVFAIVYQQIENYVLTPPLSARTRKLHPAVAFGAVVVGVTLLGPVGALLALPITATVQAVVSSYVQRHELVDSELLTDSAARRQGRRDGSTLDGGDHEEFDEEGTGPVDVAAASAATRTAQSAGSGGTPVVGSGEVGELGPTDDGGSER